MVFTLPRMAAWRTFVMSHQIHHRGQFSVYLRLNDIAVPAIYGPRRTSSNREIERTEQAEKAEERRIVARMQLRFHPA